MNESGSILIAADGRARLEAIFGLNACEQC
jgi:hypothetical protein